MLDAALILALAQLTYVPCRALLDAQLEEVFGTSDLNSGKILTLTEFLHCLHASQVCCSDERSGGWPALGAEHMNSICGQSGLVTVSLCVWLLVCSCRR